VKFIIDAQLPPSLAIALREAGYDAAAVREIGLREAKDAAI
jgi:predicted nuclease of predicted toxin-antitoxin system